MKVMRIYKLSFGLSLIVLLALQSCSKGIVDDEVPAEYKSALHINGVYAHARELFYNKLQGVNYEGAPLQNYVQQVTALAGAAGSLSGDAIIEKVPEEGLPGNELWRYTINLADSATYTAPNLGWVFVKSEFDKDNTMNPAFIDLDENGHCSSVKLPVDIKRLVVSFAFAGDYAEVYNNEVAENIDGAPRLGVPGDFSVPRRYLIQNKWKMDDGTRMQRVVEIRVQFASNPKY